MQEDFQKQSLVMSDKAKMDKKRTSRKNNEASAKNLLVFQKEIQEMENKMKGPIIDRVREIVTSVSKSKS